MTNELDCFVDVLTWLGSAAADGDLRSEPRIEVRAPVTLVLDGGARVAAETRDLTPAGVCVVSTWSGKPGEKFCVELGHVRGRGADRTSAAPILLECRVCYGSPSGTDRFRIGGAFSRRV